MNILVVNCGSSSLKYQLIDSISEKVLAKGLCERIGGEGSCITHTPAGGTKKTTEIPMRDHSDAIKAVIDHLIDPEVGVITSLKQIDAVGHRIVHGGEKFNKAVLITDDVVRAIEEVSDLAPLHNPANLIGIDACRKMMPGVPMVAVFDTAFHQTMPPCAARYAIPDEFRTKYGIRKYGFHGTSHHFVTLAAAEFLGKPADQVNLVTCHLGNGSSLAAIKNGKVYDTTMGLTPLAGVVMGTRSGDIDPAVVLELVRKGMTADEIDTLLNKKSGLLGVGGINSGDMRDMVNAAAAGTETAELALQMWAHRIVQYIGGYFALIGGADAIVFTGGIGENSRPARARILSRLACLGVDFDEEANATRSGPCYLSKPGSRVAAIVMPTDEELMIARETYAVVTK